MSADCPKRPQSPCMRFVYLEDMEEDSKIFSTLLKKIFERIFGNIELIITNNVDEFQLILAERPHAVIVDNDLGLNNKNGGIRIISEMKSRFPDVLFCLFTSKGVGSEFLGAFHPNPSIIISKQHVGFQEYDDFLAREMKRLIRRLPAGSKKDIDIDFRKFGPRHGGRRSIDEHSLLSLIEQCVHPGTNYAHQDTVEGFSLEPILGGFSGSGVFNFLVKRDKENFNVPAILKVSELVHAISEYENYLKFVKWRLPYTWRVDVLGSGVTEHFGAICYSFALGGGGQPNPVNYYLRKGHHDIVDIVVSSILHSSNQTWYKDISGGEVEVRTYFGEKPFYRNTKQREDRQDRFLQYIRHIAEITETKIFIEDSNVIFGELEFQKPNKIIFSHDWGRIQQCVSHGDLNGNNVLYSGEGEHVVFIDFQNTGMWHQFRDFISFESSIRLELPGDGSANSVEKLMRYCLEEISLNEKEWNQKKSDTFYLNECIKIRKAAHENFPEGKYHTYCIANAVHNMWLLDKSKKWSEEKKIRLAANIIGACIYLNNAAN